MTEIKNGGILEGNLSHLNEEITGNLSVIIIEEKPEIYEETYTVIPLAFEDQVLETEGKKMIEDVTVTSVPYYETTNDAGGYTVSIAS